MCKAVLEKMDEEPPAWDAHPMIVETLAEIREDATEAARQAQAQLELHSVGFTQDKQQAREALCDRAHILLRKIRSYARRTANRELLAAVDYSRTELALPPETAMLDRCAVILERATTSLAELAPYEVTREEVDALAAALEAYRPLSAKQDVRAGRRKAATAALRQRIDQLEAEMAILDDLVEALVPDEAFRERYRNARQINDGQ